MKRCKSFSQIKMEQDRPSDLGLVSIESQLLISRGNQIFSGFSHNKFGSAERRMEFTFK